VKKAAWPVAAAVAAAVLASLPPRARPDVVLITVDTLRQDHLPFYSYPADTAPFLTAIAREGVVFENAYATSSWTAPATASIFTGLYPIQHGVLAGRMAVRAIQKAGLPLRLNRIPRAADTIAEVMKRAGYSTWAVTQNANVSPEMGFDQGFDLMSRHNPGQRADDITAALLELRPRILARRPYFLYLHYMAPHQPYEEHEPFFDATLQGDARRVSAYDSEIRHVDEHIGVAFRAMGWEKALLMLVADHGEELGDRGRFGHAKTLYAEVLKVPLVVHAPGLVAGRRQIYDRVSQVDILPTFRDLLGVPQDPACPGTSLWPLLRREGRRLPDRTLFADLWPGHAQREREPWQRATIRGRFKLVQGPDGALLFDLDRDWLDMHDRAAAYPEIALDLRRRHGEFEATAPRLPREFEETPFDARLNEDLKALGYVQDK
jgi:arylsulfatase A-like enzyme